MPKEVQPNEVYTDLLPPWQKRVEQHNPPFVKSELEMWIDIVKIVKQGMLAGNISIKTLQNRYTIKRK